MGCRIQNTLFLLFSLLLHMNLKFSISNLPVNSEAGYILWWLPQFPWDLFHHLYPKFMWCTEISTKTLSVLMRGPHLWPMHCESDLYLAFTPVSEVSLQILGPNNPTRPLLRPYRGNKNKSKPGLNLFKDHFCACACAHVCICVLSNT